MVGLDTNILLYALQADSPRHSAARGFVASLQGNERVVISELVLVELYSLLRNPAISVKPLGPGEAVQVVDHFRRHPRWRLVGFPTGGRDLHDQLWRLAAQPGFAFRKVYDTRLALTLLAAGVTEFATANVKDFQALGFERVWNPVASNNS